METVKKLLQVAIAEDDKAKVAGIILKVCGEIKADNLPFKKRKALNVIKGYCLAFIKLRRLTDKIVTCENLDKLALISELVSLFEIVGDSDIPDDIKLFYKPLRSDYSLEKSLKKINNRIVSQCYEKNQRLLKYNRVFLGVSLILFISSIIIITR